ncbi:conserved domain protein, putative [Synechococcus sp. PCC 7335]|uniref:sulfite exporter TauE/SafE family protein n=1 Tax=Synechococcus sp. (strain ATCC 29403 / PCC 7335) TaxID=91464 RepID=UPI00017EB894|nr:sulfite exporter TauE/SafE family protein [Synechococcus sp. PCC 7335]EDX86099.1 conserved domain protein, putative [Synechococcus sp. PCC 7335]
MTTEAIIILTVGVASFIRGVSGFGAALIIMPVLSGLTSIYVAAPLVAILGLTIDTLLCFYYRRSFDWGLVAKLWIGSILGIPLGFVMLRFIPGNWMLLALGLMIVVYAIYALFDPAMPILQSQRWMYGTGFLCGALGSSYNIPGPPIILYGNSQRWGQEKFKSNLSVFFWGNAVFVVLGHIVQNRLTETVFQQYMIAIPSMIIGLFSGIILSRFFNPLVFRRVVLVILILVGIRLFVLGLQS